MNQPHSTEEQEIYRIVQAMETAPKVTVPEDFAARVLAQLPARSGLRCTLPAVLPGAEPHFGRAAVMTSLLVLLAAMLATARYASASSTWQILQGVLFVEFAALLLWAWLTLRRAS